ncbi:unnamed protein product [Lymnaea stagnalis]|uniref:Uncharacterized protein n=1 Tax=Lymnaea stagnalis TaxID=6523 RepID=A0AAV2H9P7_LYMST
MSRRRCFRFISVFKLWMFCVFTSILTFVLIHLHRGMHSHGRNPELSFEGSRANRVMKRVDDRDLTELQKNTTSARWIVLDAIGSTCNHVTNLSTTEGWRIIVVALHTHEIKDCVLPKCQLLTSENFYELLGHLSTSKIFSTPSKTSGYLLAVSQGATSIYDGKCRNGIFDLDTSLDSYAKGNVGCLMYNDTDFFNLFEYSDTLSCGVERSCWDYYSNAVNSKVNLSDRSRFFLKDFNEVSVVQSVTYDIACAETTKTESKSWLPTVVVGPRTLTPLETGSTLFHGDAIQWMFLPTAVPKWFSELFRTLSIHALKKSRLLNVAIRSSSSSSRPTDKRPSACELTNAPVVVNVSSVLYCVNNARCRQGDASLLCGIQIVRKVLKCMKTYVHLVNSTAVVMNSFFNAWMEDYQKLTTMKQRDLRGAPVESSVEISLGINKHIWKDSKTSVVQHVYDPVRRICPRLRMNLSTVWDDWKRPVIEDVVLVVVVDDKNIFTTIPYLEFTHRRYFRHFAYCGRSMINFRRFLQATGLGHITYIAGLTHGVNYTYQCISQVMKVGLPVKGYLLIMDTVLLNPWMLVDFPRDFVWMPQGFSKLNSFKTKSLEHWMNWNEKSDRKSMISIFEELQKAAIGNSQYFKGTSRSSSYKQFAQRFLKIFSENLASENVLFRPLEIVYIPEKMRNDFIVAAELFQRFNATVEMAVPVMSFGLAQHVKIIYMKGSNLNGENSKHPWFYFSEENSYFINPFPLKEQLKTPLGRQFYCGKYLTTFMDSLKNFRVT